MNRLVRPPAAGQRPANRSRPTAVVCEGLEDRRLLSAVVALSGRDRLSIFDSANPGQILATSRVRGLQRGESLLGIDFRPANGLLYGVGSSNRLYRIDPTGGIAQAVGAPFQVALDPNAREFGVDFNPVPDRLRVISNTGQNLRINPDTGAVVDADEAAPGVQTDAPLAYVAGDPGAGTTLDVGAVAYNNNFAGATTTTLYNLDATRDTYLIQGSPGGEPVSPNTGQLTTFASLGVDITNVAGFDIETTGTSETGFAALNTGRRGRSGFYTIDVPTGAATLRGQIRGPQVRGLAVAPANGVTLLAADRRNNLYTFNSVLPGVQQGRVRVRGLGRGERIVGLDVRPATGAVIALTTGRRLYTIDPTTGTATAAQTTIDVDLDRRAAYGVDFNPSVDLVRVVNTSGQNLRVNPVGGAAVDADPAAAGTQPDTNLAYAPGDPNVTRPVIVAGAAYTNNLAAGTPTTLYVLDTGLDILATQGSQADNPVPVSHNTGQLFTVGSLGVDASTTLGFDIVTRLDAGGVPTDTAFAAIVPEGAGRNAQAVLTTINLATGAVTPVAAIGRRGTSLVGVTVLTP